MNAITSVHQKHQAPIQKLCKALGMPKGSYYRYNMDVDSSKPREKTAPRNSLSQEKKQVIMDLLHSERFVDRTPYDIYYTLLDNGKYVCSPRTIYRLLTSQNENVDRRNQRRHRDAVKPELMAIQPNETWSWDITKLMSMQRLVYFHLYVILDIYSRYVVGWLIADKECKELARKLIHKSALKHNIKPEQLGLHSDNGPSMKSNTVAQLLDHLSIAKTHNRPYTSNDNPFSESQFKTLKYSPQFPSRFNSLKEAEAFCQKFFNWYNQEHYHSGIAWLTPETVHYNRADMVLERRHATLMEAYRENPLQFNNKAPKLKKLPKAVYINPPQAVKMASLQEVNSMAK